MSAFLAGHLTRREYNELRRWREGLLDYGRRHPYVPALLHGDFWYENLLFDDEPRRLVGVIDFENASIGDPAIDLATQGYMGDGFARAVIGAYYGDRVPNDLAGRVKDLMGLRELLGLEHGLVTGDVDTDALGKVRETVDS